MAMASLNASLLARKGAARPVISAPHIPAAYANDAPKTTAQSSQKKSVTLDAPAYKPAKLDKHKYAKKAVRLSKATDKDLRLLAASLGTSQQAIMEQAITDFLKKAYRDRGCICRKQ